MPSVPPKQQQEKATQQQHKQQHKQQQYKYFENKEYDVSINPIVWGILCPLTFGAIPYKTQLQFGSEEVEYTLKKVYCWGTTESFYKDGRSTIQRGNCCCCVNFASSFGGISPGCGCHNKLVDEIVTEMKERQRGRRGEEEEGGDDDDDQGQNNNAATTTLAVEKSLEDINNKLDRIMDHLQKMER